MAEAHPVGFRWVIKARERGALVIHVDPRFSRTSAHADLWAPIRAGSDIAFFGGLINYVLSHDRVFRDYVVAYTNASILVREDFAGPEDLNGLFSGWQPNTRAYDSTTWQYDVGDDGMPRRDPSLKHPRTIYQQLVKHFARYTPEMVERACGIPRETFLTIADRYTSCSGPDRTATICYAVGLTQHSVGVQIVRSAAILQLLLGNVGRPGGGILALRGHATIQGSTDIPTLYDLLPGYLPMPAFGPETATLARYVDETSPTRRHVVELRRLHGEPAEGLVRRRGAPRERLRLRLAPADLGRSLAPGVLARDGGRPDGRSLRHGPESGRRRAECRARTARARPAQVARRARHGRGRDRVLLEGLARSEIRRARSAPDRHRGVFLSGRRPCRKRRQLHQHAADGAVAREGRRRRRATAAATAGSSFTSAGA